MSMIASAAVASAASPTVNLYPHGHRKGGHTGATDASASSSTQGPATTQSLLSSLFESIEQVIGVSVTAPSPAVSATTPVAAAVSAVSGAGAAATPNASTAFRGIGSHIDTKV